MTREIIFIQQDGPALECLLERVEGSRAVVVTHPHPLYGGDMYNDVVETVSQAYKRNNFTTMRFNFRGVGRSSGLYDHGAGERDDVVRALGYLMDLEKSELHLAGYSFGAWVNGMALRLTSDVACAVMVSPPVGFLDFDEMEPDERVKLVLAGSRDDLAPESMLREACRLWNPQVRLEILNGADHFYGGLLPEVGRIIDEFLQA
ncbi:MAG TPA: alpha/beta hydrolase [Desulfobacteraceae bacterium]|nr:alpha/beta hydrolase [Desulfobacteraceae bacterium]